MENPNKFTIIQLFLKNFIFAKQVLSFKDIISGENPFQDPTYDIMSLLMILDSTFGNQGHILGAKQDYYIETLAVISTIKLVIFLYKSVQKKELINSSNITEID